MVLKEIGSTMSPESLKNLATSDSLPLLFLNHPEEEIPKGKKEKEKDITTPAQAIEEEDDDEDVQVERDTDRSVRFQEDKKTVE